MKNLKSLFGGLSAALVLAGLVITSPAAQANLVWNEPGVGNLYRNWNTSSSFVTLQGISFSAVYNQANTVDCTSFDVTTATYEAAYVGDLTAFYGSGGPTGSGVVIVMRDGGTYATNGIVLVTQNATLINAIEAGQTVAIAGVSISSANGFQASFQNSAGTLNINWNNTSNLTIPNSGVFQAIWGGGVRPTGSGPKIFEVAGGGEEGGGEEGGGGDGE